MDHPTEQLFKAECIACSFKPMVHPQYEAIRQECDRWIVALLDTPSAAAAQYCIDCLFPLFGCLIYPECAADRIAYLVKFFAWYFLSDTDDDHPSLSGSEVRIAATGRRHQLLIALHAGQLTPVQIVADDPCTIKGLQALHEVWQHIAKDMSGGMQARFVDAMRDYLNSVKVQTHYRGAGQLPGNVEEYFALRRPASLGLPCFILAEYGLGIELDHDAVHSELMLQLHDAVVDHISLVNDVLSCEAEIFCEDYINLPCILRKQGGSAMTLKDAMHESLRMIEDLDRRCVRLFAEVKQSSLINKPGMRAYLRFLGFLMSGNKEWCLKTARYTHVCAPPTQQQADDNDVVLAVPARIWA